jgi:hypothetical protein
MQMDKTYEDQKQALEAELALLSQVSLAQGELRRAVLEREWTNFEGLLERVDSYTQRFGALDEERLAVFSVSKDAEGAEPHFYTLLARFPEAQRRELSDLYRSLKTAALKVRLENDALSSYIAEAKALISSFINAAFPDRKGGIYSKDGKAVAVDMSRIVVDQSL